MIRLSHRPALDGSFSHGGKDYRIEDGVIEVDDPEVARDMAEHPRIEIADIDETRTPDADDREEICGAEMTDGSTCERPADSCPYHN
jgi:hypothetical protein